MKRKPLVIFLSTILAFCFISSSTAITIFSSSDEDEDEEDSSRGGEELVTYENDVYGFSIQYPSNWEVDEKEINEFTEILKEDTLDKPWEAFEDVCFLAPDIEIKDRLQGGFQTPARICVTVLDVKSEEFLDTKDMTVKTRPMTDMSAREIAEADHNYESQSAMRGASSLGAEASSEIVSSNETTFGVGSYPAWRIDSTPSATSQFGKATDYDINIYSVIENKIFMLLASSVDLVAPQYLPTLQKMIGSFHITE